MIRLNPKYREKQDRKLLILQIIISFTVMIVVMTSAYFFIEGIKLIISKGVCN